MTQLYCSQMRKGSEDNSSMLEEIANKKWDLNSKGFARQPMMRLGYNLGRRRVGYYLQLGRPSFVFGYYHESFTIESQNTNANTNSDITLLQRPWRRITIH